MLNLFRNPVLSVVPEQDDHDLLPANHTYVHTVLLDGPSDVGQAQNIWRPARTFGLGGLRLKDVVESAAYRSGSQELVPDSVVVEIAAETVERDRRIGGQMTTELAHDLAELHKRDFAKRMPSGREPSYRVQAAPDVVPGKVRVRLGPAIHVPQPGEALVWQVELSIDGVVWDAVPAVCLSEHQRLFILSGSAAHGSQVCPVWPFLARLGLVILNLPGQSRLDLSAEPLESLQIKHNTQTDWYVVRQADGGPDAPCLYLRIKSLQPAMLAASVAHPATPSTLPMAAPQPDVLPVAGTEARVGRPNNRQLGWLELHARVEPVLDAAGSFLQASKSETAAPQARAAVPVPTSGADDAPTLVYTSTVRAVASAADDAPTMLAVRPVPSGRLSLQGLAVQRPSLFAQDGVQGLHWGVDTKGNVVRPDSATSVMRFEVTALDELHVHTVAGHRILQCGDAVPLKGGDTVLRMQPLPAPLSDTCIGWLSLPSFNTARIQRSQKLVVGRQANALQELRPLAGSGFLVGLPEARSERMGLSRKHMELRLTPEGLDVRSFGTANLAHMDEQMQYLATITVDQPALLSDGHHLVLGQYVWRYHA